MSLAQRVVALRMKVFEHVNGDNVITVPGERLGPERFRELYSHPAARGRSRGAGLSDLFWYWLSPGPEVHQEHLEDGPRYDDVARTTSRILAGRSEDLAATAARCTATVLRETGSGKHRLVRLRDLMMPVWAEFFYETVFRRPCPRGARDLIVAHADDVVTALKCTGFRHMERRTRLTRYLAGHLDDVPHELPASLTRQEQVYYLQGTFFNTAVVQMSEGMTHLLLALAQHHRTRQRAATGDDEYLAHVIDETMRLYPLFGIAHRITTGEIVVDEETTLPSGSVLCFDYPGYHASGYPDPERFDPSRWEALSAKDAPHVPFGIAANRPCPAWRLAPLAMRASAREVLRWFDLDSTVAHTRSLPSRGPCLLIRRGHRIAPGRLRLVRIFLRSRDRWEDVWRSVAQLVLGTCMVLDARRRRLAVRYFEEMDRD
ncbi:cytochrome P450 [Amycolatopsis pigmentata]|uniref:Cytochrome P450 n=1 Tax=Amycolatopsis pigmentata TaxID=450801 RepID=A0ABW5FP64_9PSEU